MPDPRSRIPGIDALLGSPQAQALVRRFGRARTVDALRGAVEAVRAEIRTVAEEGGDAALASWAERAEAVESYTERAEATLAAADVPSLREVVNATGVVLHTNLGRAPLAQEVVAAMQAAAARYTNLEFDLHEGRRGSRYVHCVALLKELTGAEDALVVNNAAAALILSLNTLARGAGVAVSRGELVEIGGGFRIPEIIERAGAELLEVGSTNRTRVDDYRTALVDTGSSPVRAMLKVHRSNFRITGFTEEASVSELAGLAGEKGVPLVHDLGSGLMVPAADLGLPEEPLASASLADGADVVVVSGDKLLGAPQAGVLLGRADLIGRMRRNPLCRALRVDKVTLAGLEATLRLYRDPAHVRERVPTLAMLSVPAEVLESRARALAARLPEAGVPSTVVPARGAVGGGTYPGVELDSRAVELSTAAGAEALATALRDGSPPVVGRILDETLRLDVRTVFPDQEDDLVRRVVEATRALETGGR